jgi:hypothetical protein
MIIKNPSADKFDIIVVAGQSNAQGCGRGGTKTPFIPDQRIIKFNTDFKAEIVSTPYGDMIEVTDTGDCYLELADERCENGDKKASFALSFAKKYLENNLEKDRKVLLVFSAIGGTGFAKHHWGKGEKLTVRTFNMVDAALSMNKENRVVAVLWHQGEHDVFENAQLNYQERYDFYRENLFTLIHDLRERYGEVPFVSASFCPLWTAKKEKEKVEAVLDAYKSVYEKIKLAAHVFNVDDLKSNSEVVENCGDEVHFCRDSSYELGRRYYEKYMELIKENK